MAGPAAGYVRLPDDSGNAGKKIQTQSEVIGADTVYSHFYISRSKRRLLGLYGGVIALQSVLAAAQNGTTTGALWMGIAVGSTVRARIRKLDVAHTCAVATAIDHPTAPRIILARFTFTGTASGTAVTAAKRHGSDPTNVATLYSTSAGWTPTLGASWWNTVVPGVDLTTSGIYNAFFLQEFDPKDEEEFLDFGAGEGVVLYQADAGTTSDQRKFGATIRWDEYDNA